MKKMTYFPTLLLFVQFCFVFSLSQAQVDKNAAAVQKLETGITNAKNNVAKNEKMLAVADSLVNKGTAMINESKAEAKAIAADRKKMDKEYATSRKALEKLSFAKDKAEVTKAKADLKVLDAKYKADAKNLDNRQKLVDKNSITGANNLSKGKTNKKTAQDGLKTAQAALEAAQTKYDDTTNPAEEGDADKKKKK
jgi:hypothetical protein